MTKYTGRQQNIGAGKETSRGVVAAPAFFFHKSDFDFDDKSEKIQDESSINRIEQNQEQYLIKRWGEGQVSGPITVESFGLLLLAAFGDVTSSLKGGETVVYEHVYAVQQSNQHQSLTLALDEPNAKYDFALGMLNSLELNFEPGTIGNYVANFMAKPGVAGSVTPAYTEENRLLGRCTQLKFADTVAGLAAADNVRFSTLSMTIEKNLESIFQAGDTCDVNLIPEDILNTDFKVTGTIELVFEDEATFRTVTLADTRKAMRINIINSGVTIGTASNPELLIDFDKVKFREFARTGTLGEVIKQTVEFEAFFDIDSANMLTATLTNETSSY